MVSLKNREACSVSLVGKTPDLYPGVTGSRPVLSSMGPTESLKGINNLSVSMRHWCSMASIPAFQAGGKGSNPL